MHINFRQKYLKAFTLIELLIVLAGIALLVLLGLTGFLLIRDSVLAQNTALKLRSVFRDTQDKAFTVAIDQSSTGSRWIYGYALQKNQSTYDLYELVDSTNTIPTNDTNTNSVRTAWASFRCSSANLGGISGFNVECNKLQTYTFDSPLLDDTSCDAFYSSVNGKITLGGNNGEVNTCSVKIKQNTKQDEFRINNKGVGEIDICESSCS